MPQLLKYLRETGAIVGVWESDSVRILAAHVIPDDPLYGYLPCALEVTAREIEDGYLVRDGVAVVRSLDRKD